MDSKIENNVLNYLANNDIFIQGDAQMLLPLLRTKLLEIDYKLTPNRF